MTATPTASSRVATAAVPGAAVAGIDIGGTKIATLVVTPDGAVLGRATHPSSMLDQAGAVRAITACLDDALDAAGLARADLDAIGVGVPGRVDPERGHVTLAVNLHWADFGLGDALEAATGRSVVVENDARAAALGLLQRGHVGTAGDVAYLAVGTGIAAGVVIGGRLHRGARGLAGEIGHAIVDPDGPTCGCGQAGCLEAFASGPSIARRAVAGGRPPGTTSIDVYRAAAAGEPWALALADDVGRRLAWAIHTLVMVDDVEVVVVGGGVSHAGDAFTAPLVRAIERLRASSPLAATMVPAAPIVLAPEAEPGAWGAVAIARAALARDGFERRPTALPEPRPIADQGSEVVGHV